MSMTIGIKSSGDRHLDLYFRGSNEDGNGKWGSLHIAVSIMHEEFQPVQTVSCELNHADIDKLIQELQAAKALLVPDDSDNPYLGPDHFKQAIQDQMENRASFRRLFLGKWVTTTPPIELDTVCSRCGFKYAEHSSYSEFCIERVADSNMNMRRFSRTERFKQ